MRDDLQHYILTHLADPEAVLVVAETGFLKQGKKSVGVAAQYTGTAGKIANRQIGVGSSLCQSLWSSAAGSRPVCACGLGEEPRALKGGQVYPKSGARRLRSQRWPSRCSHVTRAHGVKAAWVTGDTVYGGDYKLRSWLEERLQPYVLAAPKNQRIPKSPTTSSLRRSW